jgi:hypothetical protein
MCLIENQYLLIAVFYCHNIFEDVTNQSLVRLDLKKGFKNYKTILLQTTTNSLIPNCIVSFIMLYKSCLTRLYASKLTKK